MRKPGVDGTFLACLLFNIVFNFAWTIPAWILLACHFIFGISLLWFVAALLIFLLYILIGMWFMGAMTRLGNSKPAAPKPTPEEEAAKREEILRKSREVGERYNKSINK